MSFGQHSQGGYVLLTGLDDFSNLGHDFFGEQLQGVADLVVRHAEPLHAKDEAIDAKFSIVAYNLLGDFVGRAE